MFIRYPANTTALYEFSINTPIKPNRNVVNIKLKIKVVIPI